MKFNVLLGAGVLAMGASVLLAPTAAAQDAGFSDYPCSEEFAVPWSVDAWTGTHEVVISPYGTADIRCASFHGQTSVYQTDPQGRKHALNNPLGVFVPNLYLFDPAAY